MKRKTGSGRSNDLSLSPCGVQSQYDEHFPSPLKLTSESENTEIDVCLMTGGYIHSTPTVVQLYGRSKDGRSVMLLCHDFDPYFHIANYNEDVLETVENAKSFVYMEDIILTVGQDSVNAKKIYLDAPWNVPKLRDKVKNKGAIPYSADILFHLRYMWDNDMGGCNRVWGEEDYGMAELFAVDVAIHVDKVRRIDKFMPPLKKLSFDIEASLRDEVILCIGLAHQLGDGPITKEIIYGKEKDILRDFEDRLRDIDPDVITGYNINGFDIPLLLKRTEHHKGKKYMSIGHDCSGFTQNGTFANSPLWKTNGRVIIDAWMWAKKQIKPKRETLNYVAGSLKLGTKLGIDTSKIEEEWATRPDEVMEYCMVDAELALLVLNKIRTLNHNLDLSAAAGLPLSEVIVSRNSMLIDSILIPAADKKGIGVPMTRKGEKKERKIVGGYVKDIVGGIYNWTVVLDFKSMYPYVIIDHNLCFTTKVKSGGERSPNGAFFLQADKLKGLIPEKMEELMVVRDTAKAMMKVAEDDETRDYYDGLQAAVKILMNSFFGVLGSVFYRFTDNEIGEAITTWSQNNIKKIIKQLEDEGQDVVYSDTDSIFIRAPIDEDFDDEELLLDEVVEFGEILSTRYTREGAELEFEKVMNPLFSHGKKKRYVGKVLWPKEEIYVRGYEMRRTDSFDILTDTLEAVFEALLDRDEDKVVQIVKDCLKSVYDGDCDVDGLVLSKSVKSSSEYKNPESQAHVQAARKRMELGFEFIPGTKVSYVVTDHDVKPMEVEPVIEGRDYPKPDNYYYTKRLAETFAKITDTFGWDETHLMNHAMGQKDLFSFGAR